jgi:hypothetical protein
VLDNYWAQVFDLPKANDDMMDATMRIQISRCLHCLLSTDSAETYYFDGLKQDFNALILECFEPGINVSICADVAFTTDVSIDTMTLCMMQ